MDYETIYHSDSGDHKYIAKVRVTGQKNEYRYFYDKDEYLAYLKDTGAEIDPELADEGKGILDKLFGNVVDKLSKTPDMLNKAVDKTKKVLNDIYDGKEDNIYDMNARTYDKKIEKVRESEEWKAIVANKDPEYVRKNSDGTTNYLIDDYVAKKKAPVLDVLDDIISNRPITVNKIEKDAIVAGVKEQAVSVVNLGIMAVGAATKFLLEKSKVRQGSYQDEMEDAKKKVEAGAKMVDSALETASQIDEESVRRTTNMVVASKQAAQVASAAQSIDEQKVVSAARTIMASDTTTYSAKSAEASLGNLSEEELALLSALLKSMNS